MRDRSLSKRLRPRSSSSGAAPASAKSSHEDSEAAAQLSIHEPDRRRAVIALRSVLPGAVALMGCLWLAAGARADSVRAEPSGTAAGWLRLPDAARTRYALDIREISARHGMSPALVEAVIRVESAFNPQAVSRKGARGLMQLMPETANALGVQDSFDPRQNIDGGVRHLRRLIDRYPGDLQLALAAYNAGVGAVDSHGGIPPYPETQQYVRRVLQHPGLTAPMPQRSEEAGERPTPTDAPATDPASVTGRLSLLPGEAWPALPLIDEARRSSRPALPALPGLATSTLARRLQAHTSDDREPISRMLARMRQQGPLSDPAGDGSARGSRAASE